MIFQQAKIFALLTLLVLSVLSCGKKEAPSSKEEQAVPSSQAAKPSEKPAMQGMVYVTEKSGVKVHTYVAIEDSLFTASHIIEGPNKLVVVNPQFFVPFAMEARAYADGLGKPIDRVYVTHIDPDYYFGLVAFKDVPSYTLASIKKVIDETGAKALEQRKQFFGELVPESLTTPTNVFELGTETIDGVKYVFELLVGGESPTDEEIVIKLPDHGILMVQDLASNNMHAVLATDIKAWTALLDKYGAMTEFDTVLVGHGEPTDLSVFAENAKYLKEGGQILMSVKSAEELKTQLLQKFPNVRAAKVIDLYAPYVFPKK